MAKVISISNQKGGVGKTTTAVNLSAALAKAGRKVLIIDLDSQGNATLNFDINKSELKATLYTTITKQNDIKEAIVNTSIDNLHILPGTIDLAGLDHFLFDKENRDFFLDDIVSQVKDQYDFIIIDCPPALGLSTINAFCASDSVLIPVQCHFFALDGLSQLFDTIRIINLKLKVNRKVLDIEGILLTMLDSRQSAGYHVVSDVNEYFNEKVFNTIIPLSVHAQEAPRHGLPVTEYMPKSSSAIAYTKLATEVINKNV